MRGTKLEVTLPCGGFQVSRTFPRRKARGRIGVGPIGHRRSERECGDCRLGHR